jgi:hypothetical protein
MATGLIKVNSVISVMEEVTEGVYVPPAAATDFIQPLRDGFSMGHARELVERTILTNSPGMPTPRLGIKSATAAVPVEYRASGTAGGAPDFHALLKGALGFTKTATATTTTTGHTSTVINMAAPDAAKYSIGDIVVVKRAGMYESRPVSAVGGTSITLAWALSNGAPPDLVVIEALRTYRTASSGWPSLSVSYYWGNEIRQAIVGARVNSMSLDNVTTGQIASFNFGLEGLTYEDEFNGAAPFTPTYDSGVPPIMLEACVWRNGVVIPVNTLSLSMTNTLGFLTDMCSENGKVSARITSREITGGINPHKDDSATNYFDDWNEGTEFSLFMSAYNPSGVAGEWDMGSVVSLWLPQCFSTEFNTEDLEGILVDQIGFRATKGEAGDKEEMYLGLT